MTTEELIKDLKLQVGVAQELYSEASQKVEGMNDYLHVVHDMMTTAAVPYLDGTILSRVEWLIARMQPADERM